MNQEITETIELDEADIAFLEEKEERDLLTLNTLINQTGVIYTF